MKKWLWLSLVFGVLPLSMQAQDDMYFVPTKARVAKEKANRYIPIERYYSGSNRSVDEYNRRGSYYQPIEGDSVSDVIQFDGMEGVYPDSVGDYRLTRELTRFDGYEPGDNFWAGYAAGRHDAFVWYSPWYYSSYYPFYDPWYYGRGWYAGWYDPWYYGWYDPYYSWGWGGYYRPWYYGGYAGYIPSYGSVRYYGTGTAGTISLTGRTHGSFAAGRASAVRSGSVARANSRSNSASNRTVDGHVNYGRTNIPVSNTTVSRSSGGSFGGASSGGSFGGNRGGGSTGGGRSGGISSGGRR